MKFSIGMLADSWIAMGCLKVAAIAIIPALLLPRLRQHRLALSLWTGFMLLLPVVFFSGLLPFSWRILPGDRELVPQSRILESHLAPEGDPTPQDAARTTRSMPEPSPATDMQEQMPLLNAPAAPSLSRDQWLLLLWIAGGIISLLPGLRSLFAARLLQQEEAAQEIAELWKRLSGDLSSKVPLFLSSAVTGPGVIGIFRNAVVLPGSAANWSEARLECVLRHELQHLRRGDLKLRWLGRLVRALLWFHPAAWWGQSRLELAQERTADEAVVEQGIPAPDYAGHLLSLASGTRGFPGIAMARQSQVGGRIRLLLSRRGEVGTTRRHFERSAAIVAGASAAAISFLGFGGSPLALANELLTISDKGFRPPIVDRNGELIATSDPLRMPEALRTDPPIRWYPHAAMLGNYTGYIFKNKAGGIESARAWGVEDHDLLKEGKALRTSIDLRIQRLAWEALERKRVTGAVVVMNPRNGEVLAMASWPSYDPNLMARGPSMEEYKRLSDDPRRPFQNRAVLPETPGSIAKVLVALAAAKEDQADRIIHCGPFVQFGNHRVRDWDQNRNDDLNLSQAMQSGCNTYFMPLAVEMGRDAIAGIGVDFGFGGETAIHWPSQPRWEGINIEASENTDIDLAFAAVGQGRNRFSLLDTARIFSAIAGEKIRPPIFTAGGKAPDAVSLESLGIDWRELAIIREALTVDAERIVKPIGERGLAGIVAAKTGTGHAGLQDDMAIHCANFACFGPVSAPEYVVAVRLTGTSEEGVASGSGDAGPIGAELMKRLLDREF